MTHKNRPTLNRVLLFFILIGLFAALLPIIPEQVINEDSLYTLDPSWIYTYNHLSELNVRVGHDFYFTYGPFGYLLYPMSNNILPACLFKAVLLIYTTFIFFNNMRKDPHMVFFWELPAIIMVKSLSSMSGLVIMVLLIICLAAYREEKSYFNFGFLCLFCSFLFLVKFDLAILSVLLIISFIAICFLRAFFDKKTGGKKIIHNKTELKRFCVYIIMATAVPCLCVIEYLIYNPSFRDLIAYYKMSFVISSDYSVAMSSGQVSSSKLLILFIIFIIIVAVVLFSMLTRKLDYLIIGACIVPVLYAYKSGVVRSDDLHWQISSEIVKLTLAVLLMALLTVPGMIKKLERPFFTRKSVSFGLASLLVVLYVLRFLDLTIMIPAQFDELELSDDIISQINGSTVTAYPWDTVFAEDELDFVYYPSLQAYVAFDPQLDQMNAAFFEGSSAPEYILFENKTIDSRLMEWESPLTYMTIMANYEFSGYEQEFEERHIYLLERRQTPVKPELYSSEFFETQIDQTIRIPDNTGICTISVDFEENIYYKIYGLFYRIDPLYADLTFTDGSKIYVRVIPNQMQSENLLTIQVGDRDIKQIESISFVGDNLNVYGSDITYTINCYGESPRM